MQIWIIFLIYFHSGREVLSLICPQCPSLSFRLLSDLRGHLESQHGMKDIINNEGHTDTGDGQTDDEDETMEDEVEENETSDNLKAKVVIYSEGILQSVSGI